MKDCLLLNSAGAYLGNHSQNTKETRSGVTANLWDVSLSQVASSDSIRLSWLLVVKYGTRNRIHHNYPASLCCRPNPLILRLALWPINLPPSYSKLLRKSLCKRNTPIIVHKMKMIFWTPTSFNVRSLGASIILLTINVKRNISVEGDIRTILGSSAEAVWVKGRVMDKHSGNLEPWIAMHSNIDWEWILPTLCNLITEMTLSIVFKNSLIIHKGNTREMFY